MELATHLLPQFLFFLDSETPTSIGASLTQIGLLPARNAWVVGGGQIDRMARRASGSRAAPTSAPSTAPASSTSTSTRSSGSTAVHVRAGGSSRGRRAADPTPATAAAHYDGPVGQTHGRGGRGLLPTTIAHRATAASSRCRGPVRVVRRHPPLRCCHSRRGGGPRQCRCLGSRGRSRSRCTADPPDGDAGPVDVLTAELVVHPVASSPLAGRRLLPAVVVAAVHADRCSRIRSAAQAVRADRSSAVPSLGSVWLALGQVASALCPKGFSASPTVPTPPSTTPTAVTYALL